VNVSPEDLDTLNRSRLSKHALGVGTTLEEPVGVDVPGRGYLIRFARGRPEGFYYPADYYYDPSTREVLFIDAAFGQVAVLVNSTLEQFTTTVKAIIEAFPFYDDLGKDLNEVDVDTLVEMYEASAARLASLIREIDPVAYTSDFWQDFLVDVVHGDYATEDCLAPD
jgi:hypothetical protein